MNWLRRTRFPQLWPDLILTLVGIVLLILWFLNGRPLPPPFASTAAPSLASQVANLSVGENGKVTGTTGPGMFVCLLDDKGNRIAEGYADATGAFALDVPAPAAEGKVNYSVLTAQYGNALGLLGPVGASAPAPFEVAVAAAVAQVEPTATPEPTAEPTAAPTSAPTATAAPTATPAPSKPVITTPGAVVLASEANSVSGTSAPGADVEVFDGNKSLGKVKAGADGKWTIELPAALALGAHTISATAAEGKSESIQVLAVDAPVIAVPTGIKAGADTPVSGKAVPGARIAVTADGKEVCTATAGSDGAWTCVIPAGMAADTLTLTANVVDGAGKPVASSDTVVVNFNVPALAITDPVAGAVALASDIKTLSGTAAPGADVEVFDGERSLGKVKADADGKWTFTLPRALSAGAHSLTAVSGADKSDAVAILAVAKPVIAQVTAPRPATETPLNGNATAGAKVTVTSGDKVVCTTTAGDDGKWTCNLAADLAVDKQTLKVSVVDAEEKAVAEGNEIEVNFTPLLPVTGAD